MSDAEQRLDVFRALRNRAWEIFDLDLQQFRHDLTERTIFQRVKDHAELELHQAVDYAKDVANENRPIVIGTAALIAAWVLRGPLRDAFDALFVHDDEREERDDGAEPRAD